MTARERLARGCGLVGAGVSVAMYAVFGLMQGMVIGGTAGLILAESIYGSEGLEITGASLITRVLLAGTMLTGAVVALVMFLTAGSLLGYCFGYALGLMVKETAAGETGRELT